MPGWTDITGLSDDASEDVKVLVTDCSTPIGFADIPHIFDMRDTYMDRYQGCVLQGIP